MESNDNNGQKPVVPTATATQEVKIDDVVDAEVIKIAEFGAFVKFGNRKGLIHISQVSDSYVKKVEDHLKVGDKVKAKVIKVSPDGKIDLTLKSGKEQAPRQSRGQFPSGGRPQRETREGAEAAPIRAFARTCPLPREESPSRPRLLRIN